MDNICPSCLLNNPNSANICASCGTPISSTIGQSIQVSPLHLPLGTFLRQGKYRIEKTLGEGGFGITYKAVEVVNSRDIAIKELLPDRSSRQGTTFIWSPFITPKEKQEQIHKFKIEGEYISKCIHPNIVKVYDWFEENNTAYIVMDFIKGQPFSDILKQEGHLCEKRVKLYLAQLAEALKVVHSNNLLHRDIKPDNIILDWQDRAILIDFGNAREFIAGKTRKMTEVGTPEYAPIEQGSSKARFGPGTDFYALCASMYELLTGQLPAAATDRVHSETLIPPQLLVPSLDPQIEQIILTGMRMRVEERFQTADELIDALKGKFVSPNHRRSRQLVEQNKLAEAVQTYEKCLANEPNNGEAAVELALVQIYLNDQQAELAAQKAIQLKPNDSRSYGVLGLINCRKANWSAAVQHLQQAAKLSPNESWIQANLAWALAKSDNWQQAEIAVNQAIQLDSNSTFALGLQAWIAVNQQQWKPAIRAARLAITKSKHQVNNSQELQRWVYPCLTVALDRAVVTKQASDVERCIQEFTTQVPDSAFAWGFKAWKQTTLGVWADVIPNFEQAKRQPQAPAWVFLNVGIAHEHQQNIQGAIQAYEAYNQKFHKNAFTQFRLGTLFARQGQWQQARKCLEKAVNFKPDYAEAHHNLAWVLLNIRGQDGQVENFREMWSAYRQAAELYAQQQKYPLVQGIKQAFQIFGIDF